MSSRAEAETRRAFLGGMGMGFSSLVLGAMLHRDAIARADGSPSGGWAPPDGKPLFPPKAKNVIWLFMIGGTSHLESFDPKPALNRYAGKSIAETPFADALRNKLTKNVRKVAEVDANGHIRQVIYPLQTQFRKRGQSGIEVSDFWPHVGSCIDEIAVVRSMWTTDNDHGAQLQFHTGRHVLEGTSPAIGSWIHYGLGSLNDDLPQFVVLGTPIADCCGGVGGHGASYLGPEHDGVQLAVDPKNPLPFGTPTRDVYVEEQTSEFELLGRLNRLSARKYPDDPALAARIKSYELAFRMQTAVPEVVRFDDELPVCRRLYGLDREVTRPFGEMCLAARPACRTRSALRPDLSRFQRRRRQLGCSRRPAAKPHGAVRRGRSAHRRALARPQSARAPGRNDCRLGHRVWPHTGLARCRWPRSSSVRLLGLAGRRRHQGRHRPRRHR